MRTLNEQSMRIGFIGLGKMGLPIAKNLVFSGFNVKVYNRTVSKTTMLRDNGAHVAASPQEAATDVDILFTMLSDDAAVKEVCEKTIPAMKTGSVHVSMSTISPDTSEYLHPLHSQRNVHYLAAPVMGRPPAAETRSLYILLSGSAEAKQKADPILNVVSQRIFYLGDSPSAGHSVKLALNMMIFTVVELLSEVMLFAEKQNISKGALMDTINNTMFAAPVFRTYGTLLQQELEVPNGFALKLANKDLKLVQQTAAGKGLQLPLADLILQHFDEAIAAGSSEKDISSLITYLRNKINKK